MNKFKKSLTSLNYVFLFALLLLLNSFTISIDIVNGLNINIDIPIVDIVVTEKPQALSVNHEIASEPTEFKHLLKCSININLKLTSEISLADIIAFLPYMRYNRYIATLIIYKRGRKMNIAAYCRVSTDKADQLNSLETQKKFFSEFTEKNNHNMVRLYADEGISGTKIKNRTEFQRLLKDAQSGMFDMVVVKDISRFARNTVDFLQSIRKLKALGIETTFLTANMTVLGNSEFILTIFGALAQEESANTSKRIKFGKALNAENGRVPNMVYGYDKTIGDYFNLTINEKEAEVVRQVYDLYLNQGYGCHKIADILNENGLRTKRNCMWSQNAISRILKNELYTGKIINGKQEISDFLTGVRKEKDESEWKITERPDLQIIDLKQYNAVQKITANRLARFQQDRERSENKNLFSTLIKCRECGGSFYRSVRKYKNTYIRWICGTHLRKGCGNTITVDESELIAQIDFYFKSILSKKKQISNYIVKEFTRIYKERDDNEINEKDLTKQIERESKKREKYMEMYTDDLISRAELNKKMSDSNELISKLESELRLIQSNLSKGDSLNRLLTSTFDNIESCLNVEEISNAQLKRIIEKIDVDPQGKIAICLKVLGDLGLDESVVISDIVSQRCLPTIKVHRHRTLPRC
jgi:Site-specific recombinases, DNA invertase Pin homologs